MSAASVDKLLSSRPKGGFDSDVDSHPDISASEDEDDVLDDSRHSKLLEAIGSMDAKKKSKVKQRSEPSTDISEFQLNTKDVQGKGVWIRDLLGTLRNTPAHSQLKKQMNNVNKRKVLQTPLHKHEAEKIQRVMAYQTVNKEVSKWDQVVLSNRRAEQLSFPLHQEVVGLPTTDQFVKKFKPSTPLEQEVYKVLQGSKYAERPNKKLTQAEEEALKAMSLSEARERRAELQKSRALMSYFEAKCRRQKKIKSKKYHRIQRKSKARQEAKKVEDLMKTDPQLAQESLEKLEKSRAEERMSLKHRNTGKWAKNLMKYGRHNIQARQELATQLNKSHELTQKVNVNESNDETANVSSGEEEVATIQPSLSDINNPWFSGRKLGEEKEEEEKEEKEGKKGDGYVMLEAVKAQHDDDKEEEEEDDGDGNDDLEEERKELKMRRDERRKWEEEEDEDEEVEESDHEEKDDHKISGKKSKRRRPKNTKGTESIDEVSDEGLLEEGLERHQDSKSLEQQWLTALERESQSKLESSASKSRVEETIEDANDDVRKSKKTSDGNVDPNKVFSIKAKSVKSVAPELVVDDEEGIDNAQQQHHMNIQQAFADDDVVEEFKEEKKSKIEQSKPKDIDLTLPGWGEWGGVGVQPSKRKRKRFVIKAPPQAPRRDQKLQHVIINENRDKKIALHQVNNLPFPFTSPDQFEKSIRVPVGSTWNTPSAVKALTMPKVTTKMGTIIHPIQADEAFKGKAKKRKPEQKPKKSGPKPDIAFDVDDDKKRKKKKRKGK